MNNSTYKQTEAQVKRIKNFYNHLQIFVIMMLVVFFFSDMVISFFETRVSNPNFITWVKANIWINSGLWLLGLLIHGIYVFKFKANFIDKWEQKKIEEILKENK